MEEDKFLYGLITNNHVLNVNQINQIKSEFDPILEINFSKRKQNQKFYIYKKDIKFIFTEVLIDVTFIQLSDELIKNINPHFIKPYDSECIKEDPASVIGYFVVDSNRQKLSIGIGMIKYSKGINYCHKCSTTKASSGSPVIHLLEVAGIHKSSNDGKNENYATNINVAKYAICTAYNRKCRNEINDTMGIMKELSPDYIEDLKKHNLIKQGNSNIFKYEGIESNMSLYFYRTNHAWYWTKQHIEDSYDDKKIRKTKWTIILPHEKIKKINKDEESLSPIQKVLIMWLRLSEFMYL